MLHCLTHCWLAEISEGAAHIGRGYDRCSTCRWSVLTGELYMVPDINNDKMCYCQSENRNVRES